MELRQIFNVFVTGKLKIVLDSNYSYDIQFNFFVFKGENRKF